VFGPADSGISDQKISNNKYQMVRQAHHHPEPGRRANHNDQSACGGLNKRMTTMKVVKLAIEDVLDLHTFRPKDIPDLLEDYFTECLKAGIYSVRIIHGKGKGIQKRRVQGLLEKNSMVTAFKEAPPEAGGWGATSVELSRNIDPEHSRE
jgi:DNA-nicking Smr family endonuclease